MVTFAIPLPFVHTRQTGSALYPCSVYPPVHDQPAGFPSLLPLRRPPGGGGMRGMGAPLARKFSQ